LIFIVILKLGFNFYDVTKNREKKTCFGKILVFISIFSGKHNKVVEKSTDHVSKIEPPQAVIRKYTQSVIIKGG
jgi:hypothetical protein